jgi:hypothetical protein
MSHWALSVIIYNARWHCNQMSIQASTTTNQDRWPINLNTKLNLLLFKNAICFLSLILTIDAPKFHLSVCCIFMYALCNDCRILINAPKFHLSVYVCSDYRILNLDFASFIVEVYFWLLNTKINLHIDYQHWFVHQLSTLIYASTININSCIDYQHQILMSTCASTTNVDNLCTHTPQVMIHNYCNPCHSLWIFATCHWINQSP